MPPPEWQHAKMAYKIRIFNVQAHARRCCTDIFCTLHTFRTDRSYCLACGGHLMCVFVCIVRSLRFLFSTSAMLKRRTWLSAKNSKCSVVTIVCVCIFAQSHVQQPKMKRWWHKQREKNHTTTILFDVSREKKTNLFISHTLFSLFLLFCFVFTNGHDMCTCP